MTRRERRRLEALAAGALAAQQVTPVDTAVANEVAPAVVAVQQHVEPVQPAVTQAVVVAGTAGSQHAASLEAVATAETAPSHEQASERQEHMTRRQLRNQAREVEAAGVQQAPPVRRAPLRARPVPAVEAAVDQTKHHRHKRRGARMWVKTAVIVATTGLTATFCIPAFAYSDNPDDARRASSIAGIQSLTVAPVAEKQHKRDGYSVTEEAAALDSTERTTVSPTVQALAAKLMTDVAAGRLIGSTPDHIPEIQYLANGVAVPNCGIDYRVLQTIDVALQNFNTVGVSDINRRCTGQIEGAGSASLHYADGGGHAVDFYILNGQALTGGDANSMRLVDILDPLVPPGTNVGQSECRSSVSLSNMVQFPDSCTHLHIDFGKATRASLKS